MVFDVAGGVAKGDFEGSGPSLCVKCTNEFINAAQACLFRALPAVTAKTVKIPHADRNWSDRIKIAQQARCVLHVTHRLSDSADSIARTRDTNGWGRVVEED